MNKKLFESIIDKHNAGMFNISRLEYSSEHEEAKQMLNKLNKKNLIHFVNYLTWYNGQLYVGINGKGEFDLFDLPK
jgi:hypothetical protein